MDITDPARRQPAEIDVERLETVARDAYVTTGWFKDPLGNAIAAIFADLTAQGFVVVRREDLDDRIAAIMALVDAYALLVHHNTTADDRGPREPEEDVAEEAARGLIESRLRAALTAAQESQP